MTSAQAGHGGDTVVLTARAHDRHVRDLHRRVLERVLLKSKTQSVKDAFRLYDRNRAGVLTLDQFRALMRDHDFLETDSELLIRHLDDRGQQGISFHAFLGDIQLGTKQNYPKNGVNSPKKVQPLSQLGGGQVKNATKTKARVAPARDSAVKPVADPMESIRTKLRQRVMGSKSIREVFMEYDTDNSGFLDYDEFGRFMAKYKFTPEETQLIVDYLDKDSSGTVDYDEFAAGLLFYRPPVVVPAPPVQSSQSTPAAAKNRDTNTMQSTQKQTIHNSKVTKSDVERIREAMQNILDNTFTQAKQNGKSRDMKAEFANYDIKGKGGLDHQEFGALLIGIGIKLKVSELQAVLEEIDPGGSECIQFQAFAELLNIREGGYRSNRTLGEKQRHVPAARNEDGEQLDNRAVVLQTSDRLDEERRKAPKARNNVAELLASFSKHDREGKGKLGYEEFRRMLHESGVTNSEEIDELIDEVDKGGSGSINFNELKRVYGRKLKPSVTSTRQREEEIHNRDRGIDSDEEVQHSRAPKNAAQPKTEHNTKARLAALQEQELQFMERVLRRHQSVEAAFREFDQSNNNEMDFEQFRDFMGQFGMTDATNISMLLKRLDVDNSGTVDLQEFLSVFNEQRLTRHKISSKPKEHRQNDVSNGRNQRIKGPKLVGDIRQHAPSKGEGQRAGPGEVDSKVESDNSASSVRSNANKAARLRAVEERWIASALSGHSSIRSAFASVDRNQDGELTCGEFRELMNKYGVYDDEDIVSLTRKLDLDGSGNIAYEDFMTVFHDIRVTKGREQQKSVSSAATPHRNSAVKQRTQIHPKNVRGARLRDLQLRWMKRVMSCHDSIEAAFYQYDQDGNGELDHKEFRYFMKRYGIVRNDDIDLLIRRLDSDGSETISFDEFSVLFNPLRLSPGNTAEDLSAMVAAAPEEIFEAEELESVLEIERELAQRMSRQTRDLRMAFRKFDSNGNGLLEYKEFRAVLKSYRLPEMEIRKVIRHMDRDVSGFIDYKEFLAGFGAFKESSGTGTTGGTSQKKEASPGVGSSSKPGLKSHYRKSPPKLQTQPKPPSLETLKKRMLAHILSTHGTVQAAFREYDLDKVGRVNEAQFVTLVLDCGFSRDESARLLELFDQDQSGTIGYETFLAQLVQGGD
ncbi:hypothetical protein PHYBOEH_004630 [Phytophthora boehmeriae]|uniref:EF-hand domain-containing protein n=1 Tax=Phytophthora boehmeriae TaxID=109152 RepID=A0A8T1WR36_9STRA|nr:hypothetical protein PHYBOEH_004630 [Phytophthora boehmeriae]